MCTGPYTNGAGLTLPAPLKRRKEERGGVRRDKERGVTRRREEERRGKRREERRGKRREEDSVYLYA